MKRKNKRREETACTPMTISRYISDRWVEHAPRASRVWTTSERSLTFCSSSMFIATFVALTRVPPKGQKANYIFN